MRTVLGLALALIATAADATTLDLNITAASNAASVANAIDFPGVGAPVLRYGQLAQLIPGTPWALDSGFAVLLVDRFGFTYFEGASTTLGTLTYGQWVRDASQLGNPGGIIDFPWVTEDTRGPVDVLYPGAADYYFLINAAGAEYFASGHVDEAGTLTTLTYSGVPEPGAWAAMLLGFGLVGARRRRLTVSGIS